MDAIEAVRKAIYHYNGEVKLGENYAIPILRGLKEAEKQLKGYNALMEILTGEEKK